MAKRLTRIVTRTGDEGGTGLADGTRADKSSPRIHGLGELDELNCWLGVVLAQHPPDDIKRRLLDVQHRLFDAGAELSLPGHTAIGEQDITRLEEWLQQYNRELPPLEEFILPGGGAAGSFCHLARAVCRRAERRLVELSRSEGGMNPFTLAYINRLSDLLFVIARVLARRDNVGEVYWDSQDRDRT
jgi:cob(I)alamin adenosyltransferase